MRKVLGARYDLGDKVMVRYRGDKVVAFVGQVDSVMRELFNGTFTYRLSGTARDTAGRTTILYDVREDLLVLLDLQDPEILQAWLEF